MKIAKTRVDFTVLANMIVIALFPKSAIDFGIFRPKC